MEFTSTSQINAARDFVFSQLTDYPQLEAFIVDAGGDITRVDTLGEIGAGMAWHVDGEIRGRQRQIDIVLEEFTDQEHLSYLCDSGSIDTRVTLNARQIAPEKTELTIRIAPVAKNLSARLILQSIKLARRTISKRIDKRMKSFAHLIETRYQNQKT